MSEQRGQQYGENIAGAVHIGQEVRGGCRGVIIMAGATLPSGAPLGELLGSVGRVEARSPRYNSSFLVRFGDTVWDIHDTYLCAAEDQHQADHAGA